MYFAGLMLTKVYGKMEDELKKDNDAMPSLFHWQPSGTGSPFSRGRFLFPAIGYSLNSKRAMERIRRLTGLQRARDPAVVVLDLKSL